MYLRCIIFRADHALIYMAEMGRDHFCRRRCFRQKFFHVLEREKEKPVGDTEYGCPQAGENRAVSFIKSQAFAADGVFGRIPCIVRIFRFDQKSRNIQKGSFYILQEKGADSAAAVIFHDSEIIQKASAFVREKGKKCISQQAARILAHIKPVSNINSFRSHPPDGRNGFPFVFGEMPDGMGSINGKNLFAG